MASGLEELGIVDDAEDAEERVIPGPPPVRRSPDAPESGPAAGAEPEAEPERGVEQILGDVRLFEGLLPVHLRRMAKLAHEIEVKKGDFVFKHGDTGDGLYLILEGAIRISRNMSGMGEEALAILRPGQYFGEMSIVDDDAPRSADAIGHESGRLLRLPKNDLRDLMFVDRELAYELLWRFVRTLSGRLRESNDRLLMLTVSSKF